MNNKKTIALHEQYIQENLFQRSVRRLAVAGLIAAFTLSRVPLVHAVSTDGWLGGEVVTEEAQADNFAISTETIPVDSYEKTFVISAYYSPLSGQQKYVTGSYSGDIRLNGGGVHGADGTPVYPGMIAAPSTYAFGTKMTIPGIGTVAVHDRGGAIVPSGERGNAHDRLDVWMGYGDKGLQRALTWGKRTVTATIHGIDASIKESIDLENYTNDESVTPSGTSAPSVTNVPSIPAVKPILGQDLAYGSKGEDVATLQQTLKNLHYYDGEITSVFDEKTYAAVTKFQVAEKIVAHDKAFGVGYVGQRTIKMLSAKAVTPTETAHAKSESLDVVETFNSDLKLGDSGENVRALQKELKRINLLGIEATGFYGDVTAHAVFKFQQTNKLAGDKASLGAGIFGPKTRAVLNSVVAARLRTESLVAERESA